MLFFSKNKKSESTPYPHHYKTKMNPKLQQYIESEIIPRYKNFDKAHREDHVRKVIEQSLAIVPHYDVNEEMVYTTAAYHDTGMAEGREHHHLASGRMVREDTKLREWFSEEEIEIIAQAAEDHRASNKHDPRTIYGRIVAEADRLIDAETIVRRTVQFTFAHFPTLSFEEQAARSLAHLDEKYAEGGYLKLWIPESSNAARLREFQAVIKDRAKIESLIKAEMIRQQGA